MKKFSKSAKQKTPCPFVNFLACVFLSISLCSLSAGSVASSGQPAFDLLEIAEGVFVHQGKHVSFDSPGQDDIANIGFIVGDDCVAVIDSGGSVDIARQLLEAIKSTSSKPVCYVINTHIHFDHVLGNIIFKKDGVKFVGHGNLAGEVAANRTFFLNEYAANLGNFASESSIIAPDIGVDDTLELDLGNRLLQLKAHPAAHSHSDLSIFDSKTGTLWLSDLLFVQRIPSLDGSLKGWLATMENLVAAKVKRVVPGHGPHSTTVEKGFAAQKHYLELLLTETRESIAQGLFMEDIVEQVGASEKLKWLLHEQHHRRNVTKAFSELEWE